MNLRITAFLGLFLTVTALCGGGVGWGQTPTGERQEQSEGYEALIRAVDEYKKALGSAGDLLTPDLPPGEAPKEVSALEKKRFVRRKSGALQMARTALTMTYRCPPVRDPLQIFPELAQFRELARAFVLEADVREEGDKLPAAVGSCLDAMQLGDTVPRGGALLQKMVGIACEGIGRNALWKRVDKLDALTARVAAHRLERLLQGRLPLREAFREEKEYQVASTRKNIEDAQEELRMNPLSPEALSDEINRGRDPEDSSPSTPMIDIANVDIEAVVRRQAAYMDEIIASLERPYREHADEAVRIAHFGDPDHPLPAQDPKEYPLIQLMIVGDVRAKEEWSKAQNALLIVALALRSYRETNNDYPDDLKILVKEKYLIAVPQDAFNAPKPLRYRRVSAEKYLLYSVGPDGFDDNGRPLGSGDGEKSGKPLRTFRSDSTGDIVAGMNTGSAT